MYEGSPASKGQLSHDLWGALRLHCFVHYQPDALCCSSDAALIMARTTGPYSTYDGSPASKGQLSHDLWGVKAPSSRWDWDGLRADIARQGLRNSLLVAPMPTASTSQVCFVWFDLAGVSTSLPVQEDIRQDLCVKGMTLLRQSKPS